MIPEWECVGGRSVVPDGHGCFWLKEPAECREYYTIRVIEDDLTHAVKQVEPRPCNWLPTEDGDGKCEMQQTRCRAFRLPPPPPDLPVGGTGLHVDGYVGASTAIRLSVEDEAPSPTPATERSSFSLTRIWAVFLVNPLVALSAAVFILTGGAILLWFICCYDQDFFSERPNSLLDKYISALVAPDDIDMEDNALTLRQSSPEGTGGWRGGRRRGEIESAVEQDMLAADEDDSSVLGEDVDPASLLPTVGHLANHNAPRHGSHNRKEARGASAWDPDDYQASDHRLACCAQYQRSVVSVDELE